MRLTKTGNRNLLPSPLHGLGKERTSRSCPKKIFGTTKQSWAAMLICALSNRRCRNTTTTNMGPRGRVDKMHASCMDRMQGEGGEEKLRRDHSASRILFLGWRGSRHQCLSAPGDRMLRGRPPPVTLLDTFRCPLTLYQTTEWRCMYLAFPPNYTKYNCSIRIWPLEFASLLPHRLRSPVEVQNHCASRAILCFVVASLLAHACAYTNPTNYPSGDCQAEP